MKKILFIISLLPVLVNSQVIATRTNAATNEFQWYVTNSPGNLLNNSRWVMGLKDSTYFWNNCDSFKIYSIRSGLNHGTPASLIWPQADGTLRSSPVTSIPITSAQIADLSTFTTSNLAEGTNLYYTATRFNTAFSGKSTTDLAEGTNQYFTQSRSRTSLSAGSGIGYNSSTGVISNTSPDQMVTITGGGAGGTYPNFTITPPGNSNAAGYGTGTAYTLTTTSAKITMGTTSPTITIPAAGTYLIISNVTIDYTGLTTLAVAACNFKIRRTNNTAADIANTSTNFNVPIVTLLTQTGGDADLNAIIYTTSNSNDVLELWGSRGAVSVGNIQITNGYIVAVKIY